VTSERFTGYVMPEESEGGIRVKLDDKKRWNAALRRLAGFRFELSIGPEKKDRSLRANRYMWAIYNIIAEWSGHDPEEIHVFMKAQFLPTREIQMPGGEPLTVLGSTRKLDSVAFSDYVSKVKRWAMEQGLELPDPDQVGDL
jgi:hypothetical protein